MISYRDESLRVDRRDGHPHLFVFYLFRANSNHCTLLYRLVRGYSTSLHVEQQCICTRSWVTLGPGLPCQWCAATYLQVYLPRYRMWHQSQSYLSGYDYVQHWDTLCFKFYLIRIHISSVLHCPPVLPMAHCSILHERSQWATNHNTGWWDGLRGVHLVTDQPEAQLLLSTLCLQWRRVFPDSTPWSRGSEGPFCAVIFLCGYIWGLISVQTIYLSPCDLSLGSPIDDLSKINI